MSCAVPALVMISAWAAMWSLWRAKRSQGLWVPRVEPEPVRRNLHPSMVFHVDHGRIPSRTLK